MVKALWGYSLRAPSLFVPSVLLLAACSIDRAVSEGTPDGTVVVDGDASGSQDGTAEPDGAVDSAPRDVGRDTAQVRADALADALIDAERADRQPPDSEPADTAHPLPDLGPDSDASSADAVAQDAAAVDAGSQEDVAPAEPDGAPDVPGRIDLDRDGVTEAEGDCDDQNPTVHAQAPEICDGVDNDCDTLIDEGTSVSCYDGPDETLGVDRPCRPGLSVCQEGQLSPCRGQVLPGPVETCSNLVDDDCNGAIDDGCDQDGDQFTVADGDCDDRPGLGAAIHPNADEDCDGVDNNCDGTIDEIETDCYEDGEGLSLGVGVCAAGSSTCRDGIWGPCEGQILPLPEACGNAEDDDCDGQVDEQCEVDPCQNIDLDSPVVASSPCVTAGSDARGVVYVTLRDLAGNPLSGRDVQITAAPQIPLEPDAVVDAAGTYYRSYGTEGLIGDLRFTATVTCGERRQALRATPTLRIVPGLPAGSGLRTGGCSGIDGNVTATITDAETGAPIADAWLMVGVLPRADLHDDPATFVAGEPGQARNTARSDAQGVARVSDLGDALSGPQVVTVGADGYENVTLGGLAGSVLSVELRPVTPPEAERAGIRGAFTEFDDLSPDNSTDAGIVLRSFDLRFLSTFALGRLLGRYECWDPVTEPPFGDAIPPSSVPGNVYIPAQLEPIFGFPVRIDEHNFALEPTPIGRDSFIALSGKIPTDEIVALMLNRGSLTSMLDLLSLSEIGVVHDLEVDGMLENVTIPLTASLTDNAACAIDNAPPNASVFCVAAGDWSGARGTGRLFPMGFRTLSAEEIAEGVVGVPVATVADEGVFRGIGYLGAAVSLYLDPDDAPVGQTAAASAILDRTHLSAAGGTIEAGTFFATMAVVRDNRVVGWEPVARPHSPAVDLCRIEIVRRVIETYDPGDCTTERVSTWEHPVWTSYVAGDPGEITLPRVPDDWPRAPHDGLVDLRGTPERDDLRLRVSCMGLGLSPDFNFHAGDFSAVTEGMTHVSSNEVRF